MVKKFYTWDKHDYNASMEEKLRKSLIEIGLSSEEAKVYIAALTVWSSPASTIAKQCSLKRETCYYTLKKLLARGLMSTVIKNNVTYYTPEKPEKLISQSQWRLDLAKAIAPDLNELINTSWSQAKIKFYQWTSGIQTVMEDILNHSDEALTYTNLWLMLEVFGDEMTRFREKRREAGIKSRTISTYSPSAKQYVQSEELFEWEQILFVNNQEFVFENDVLIYWDKVAIISLAESESYGFIVESAAFAQTQKAVFDLSWLGGNMFMAH